MSHVRSLRHGYTQADVEESSHSAPSVDSAFPGSLLPDGLSNLVDALRRFEQTDAPQSGPAIVLMHLPPQAFPQDSSGQPLSSLPENMGIFVRQINGLFNNLDSVSNEAFRHAAHEAAAVLRDT